MSDRDIFQNPFALAHEIGHILGLEHTMYPAIPGGPLMIGGSKNPEKVADSDWGDEWDYWDLVYGEIGGVNTYFADRAAAYAWWAPPPNGSGLPLFVKHTWDVDGANQNCYMYPNCTLCCYINTTWECTGSQGLSGLAFTFPGDDPGQGIYRRGANAMMYLGVPQQCTPWATFSPAQADQTKRLLRADVRIDDEAWVLAGAFRGYTAKRDLLGDWRARWGFDQIDFDLDGKRDIAVWVPPVETGGSCGDAICSLTESPSTCDIDCATLCGNGTCDSNESSSTCPKDCGGADPCGNGVCGLSESPSSCPTDCASACGNGFCGAGETTTCPKDCGTFKVALSGGNYATTLERNLGRPGDMPVLADFDGDNKTDFAVVRSGGLDWEDPTYPYLWWIWCKSSENWTCGDTYSFPARSNYLGLRGDVPLPALQMDTGTANELVVYRPADRYVYWKTATDTGGGSSFYTRFESPITLLPGLYDSDNKTDFVAYNPGNARFFMVLSTTGWNHYQGLARYFDVALRPDAIGASDAGSSAPAKRHGGVPLPAESAGRRVLRVWDPSTGYWYTNWDPINSTTTTACQWGAYRDVPLAGPIDRNADGKTDMAVYRPPNNSPPTVYIRSATASLCSPGGDLSVPISGGTARTAISAVRDMSGDGRGDILALDPATFLWTGYYSQAFGAQTPVSLGQVGAMPF